MVARIAFWTDSPVVGCYDTFSAMNMTSMHNVTNHVEKPAYHKYQFGASSRLCIELRIDPVGIQYNLPQSQPKPLRCQFFDGGWLGLPQPRTTSEMERRKTVTLILERDLHHLIGVWLKIRTYAKLVLLMVLSLVMRPTIGIMTLETPRAASFCSWCRTLSSWLKG
jgi:hypothetical protein